jgi:hypothetical protein
MICCIMRVASFSSNGSQWDAIIGVDMDEANLLLRRQYHSLLAATKSALLS